MEIKTLIDKLGDKFKDKYKDIYKSNLKFVDVTCLNGVKHSFWVLNNKYITKPLSEVGYKKFVYDVSLKFHPDKCHNGDFNEIIGQLCHKPKADKLIDILLLPLSNVYKNNKKEKIIKLSEHITLGHTIIKKHTIGLPFLDYSEIYSKITTGLNNVLCEIIMEKNSNIIEFIHKLSGMVNNSTNVTECSYLKDALYLIRHLFKLFHNTEEMHILVDFLKSRKQVSNEHEEITKTDPIRIIRVGPKSAKMKQKQRLQKRITRSMSSPRRSKRLKNK